MSKKYYLVHYIYYARLACLAKNSAVRLTEYCVNVLILLIIILKNYSPSLSFINLILQSVNDYKTTFLFNNDSAPQSTWVCNLVSNLLWLFS